MSRASRLAALALVLGAGCRAHKQQPPQPPQQHASPPKAPPIVLAVPATSAALELDGEPEEAAWQHAVRTGAFLEQSGAPGRPFTEARMLHSADRLYLHLYAADDDLRAPAVGKDGPVWLCDRFVVTFHVPGQDHSIAVTARGELADWRTPLGAPRPDRSWQSGATAGVDADGSLDQAGGDDEEWAAELAVPFEIIGADKHAVDVTIERFDVGGQGSRTRELRWDGRLDLRD